MMTLGLLCVVLAMSAQRTDKLPIDKDVRVGHLDNGLTYYIRHNEQPKERAEFHIAQAVGAVLEEDVVGQSVIKVPYAHIFVDG